MVEKDRVGNIQFSWGRKRGVGGKTKNVQFYDSFTYDGVTYALYDSVYLYKEGELEPYIGKLIKIWENIDKTRRIKVLWFFRPSEILNFLGSTDARENELFLASGEGLGLSNVNPLEAIAGKCNAICISKDSRNIQPSEEKLKVADFIYYRTFDVTRRVISSTFDERIAGVETKLLFSHVVEDHPVNDAWLDGRNLNRGVINANPLNDSTDNVSEECTVTAVAQKPSLEERSASNSGLQSGEMEKGRIQSMSIDDILSGCQDERQNKYEAGKHINIVQVDNEMDKLDSRGLDDRPLKKAKLDAEKTLCSFDNQSVQIEKKIERDRDHKESKLSVQKLDDMSRLKKPKSGERHVSENGVFAEPSSRQSSSESSKTNGHVVEIAKRPEIDKSKWFRGLAWDEKMQNAQDQGSLVLLQNLDPSLTSTEVEDIVWHAFNQSCSAKMIQRTSISSRNAGQAYVIFNSRDAAETAVRKLEEGCLMLMDGRPIVGSIAPPCSFEKQTSFFGHLVIDKLRLLMPREMKEAVSTSHCSQPNTIEYDMAMDWRLLQEASDKAWKQLHKKQSNELKNLAASLKSK